MALAPDYSADRRELIVACGLDPAATIDEISLGPEPIVGFRALVTVGGVPAPGPWQEVSAPVEAWRKYRALWP